MHLEPTDHREVARKRTFRERHHALSRLVAVLLVTLALAGCVTGTANDAERARQRDATQESVLTDLQATETWNVVNGTPQSTPTPEQ